MKTIFNIFFALTLSVSFGYSQNVGINTSGDVPDASSMLDIKSTDKGLLIPRVSIPDLSLPGPVTSPANSLLVYNLTSGEEGYYFWDGAKWVKLMDTNSNADEDWYKVGTSEAPKSNVDDIYRAGKVGIGTGAATLVSPFNVVGLPEYADESAASIGGLTTGAFYRNAGGVVMVKL